MIRRLFRLGTVWPSVVKEVESNMKKLELLVAPHSVDTILPLAEAGADAFVVGEQWYGLRLAGEFLQQRNFFRPEIAKFKQTVETNWDEKGNELDAARYPLQIVRFKAAKPVYPNNMMRKGLE
ncbi:hypothetical protein F9802_00620 [Bacillus aerolatus]|uniref:Peptidase family U32 C-terminal domain-containing protein n=1 Tax=Bacillus aerolatus TaxID=2653354 RepID=A0A6I1FN50_9BACI|nr:hypothetical protein F9802_00620 [Bacillus aerolatus]